MQRRAIVLDTKIRTFKKPANETKIAEEKEKERIKKAKESGKTRKQDICYKTKKRSAVRSRISSKKTYYTIPGTW